MNTEKIRVSDDDVPDMTKSGCEFCFQHFAMAGIEASSILLDLSKYPVLIGDFINEFALIQFHQSYHSRAPPSFS